MKYIYIKLFLLVSVILNGQIDKTQNCDSIFNKKKQLIQLIDCQNATIINFKYFSNGAKRKIDSIYYINEIEYRKEYYFDESNPKSFQISNYKSYNLDGIQQLYGDDGNLIIEEAYLNNKKSGLTKYYFNNGQLFFSIEYKDGKKHGKAVDYTNRKIDVDGNETGSIELIFNDNKLEIAKFYFFSSEKEVINEKLIENNGLKELFIYDLNGLHIDTIKIKNGKLKPKKDDDFFFKYLSKN